MSEQQPTEPNITKLHRKHLAEELGVPEEQLTSLPCAHTECNNAATLRPTFLVPIRSAAGPIEYAELSMSQLVVCAEHRTESVLEYVGEEGRLNFYRLLEAGGQKALPTKRIKIRHDSIVPEA